MAAGISAGPGLSAVPGTPLVYSGGSLAPSSTGALAGRSAPSQASPGVVGPRVVVVETQAQVGPQAMASSLADATAPSRADCAWCRYGKPAVAGAVAGALVSAALGREWSQGVLWGALAGVGYGQMFRGG